MGVSDYTGPRFDVNDLDAARIQSRQANVAYGPPGVLPGMPIESGEEKTVNYPYDPVEALQAQREYQAAKALEAKAKQVPVPVTPRIGDAERARCTDYLSDMFARGYLSLEEFQERAATAATAKTAVDLAPLTADLPALKPAPRPVPAVTHVAVSEPWGKFVFRLMLCGGAAAVLALMAVIFFTLIL
jgi:hypothetical protein